MSTARPPFSLLSVAANVERHKLASGDPFLMLLLIQYPGSADPTATQQYVRLVRDLNPLNFDAGDGLGPQEYTPFNFELGEIGISTNSSVPTLDLKASNVMRALQTVIEQYSGLVGANATLMVVSTANPAGEPDLAMNFTVTQAICDPKKVTLKLGASSPMRRLFPLYMYRPNYCMWSYNSPALQAQAAADPSFRNPGKQCGYSGSMTSCTKTIDGSAGCQAHNNVLRFGGHPGVGSNGASSAGVA
jgi:phage-related protein